VRVNGSFIRAALWPLRAPHTGAALRVAFDAHTPHEAEVFYDGSHGVPPKIRENAAPLTVDSITLWLRKRTLAVGVPGRWRLQAESTIAYPHANTLRMNLKVTSLYPVCRELVGPQDGILGQTFDCDGMAIDGRQDAYDRLDNGGLTATRGQPGGTITTSAQAEGALEGREFEYLLASPF
jgi:hypothetical protein